MLGFTLQQFRQKEKASNGRAPFSEIASISEIHCHLWLFARFAWSGFTALAGCHGFQNSLVVLDHPNIPEEFPVKLPYQGTIVAELPNFFLYEYACFRYEPVLFFSCVKFGREFCRELASSYELAFSETPRPSVVFVCFDVSPDVFRKFFSPSKGNRCYRSGFHGSGGEKWQNQCTDKLVITIIIVAYPQKKSIGV